VLRRRMLAIGALVAAVALVGAILLVRDGGDPGEQVVQRFADAWQQGDVAGMYAALSDDARERTSIKAFASAYRRAAATATARAVRVGEPARAGESWRLPVRASTRIFGTLRGQVRLALEGPSEKPGIAWRAEAVFPGLRTGERLRRQTRMPARGTLLARDKTPLARGAARSSPLGGLEASVVGRLGPIPADRRARLRELGVPAGTRVGLTGLERIFDERLLGRPGGRLLAGTRVLAARQPRPAPPVRTTLALDVQRAAVAALAGRLGGVVALEPRTGEILAFAGIAFSGLQPPGSTFKIITLTGALEARLAGPGSRFPVQTEAVLEGVAVENANGESCGGSLRESFAESCNSVFAPLGARLGARRLVDVAERFGFNRAPGVPGAATSVIPDADEIGDALAVGSSAIGQGRVQATALQMADAAATIALRGVRPALTLDLEQGGDRAPVRRVTSARIARAVERLMLAVVREGTGTTAAIQGVRVAGKTGTAELRTTARCEPDPENPESCPPEQNADPTDTDAWFTAYAPAGRPRVAVGVLLVASGAGGDTAAPAARGVMLAALRRGG
jgi:cell division protein FtsI/penicillin-binding protein 2